MISTALRFVACVALMSHGAAMAGEPDDRQKQGVAIAASLVATLEACAQKYPELKPFADDPASFIRSASRNGDEAGFMLRILDSEDYRAALPEWRDALTKDGAARRLDAECQALARDFGHAGHSGRE
jgi:hypothetical protein